MNMKMWKCENVGIWKCGNVEMRECGMGNFYLMDFNFHIFTFAHSHICFKLYP